MLRISLYVVHDFLDPQNKPLEQVPYGSGIRLNKLYGKADLDQVMAAEMLERTGKTLITGTSSPSSFANHILTSG